VNQSDNDRRLVKISSCAQLSGTSNFDGLTLDCQQRKLYYADSGYGRVGELSMDGTGHRIIVANSNSSPRGIVFDKQNRSRYLNIHFVLM
jgi:hypothetical protein